MKGDILIAEDDQALLRLLRYTLEKDGYAVTGVSDGAEAAAAIRAHPFDLVLSDVKMPEMDGLALLRFVKNFDPEIDVVLLTGYSSITNAVEAVKLGAYDYLEKPVQNERLRAVVERIFERRSLRRKAGIFERREKRQFLYHDMLGKSEAMQVLFQNIERMARYNTPVLIAGESGTGKELVARALHNAGQRAKGPFVAVNGAGLVENLFESQLFGHQRGAFTGAVRDQVGLMEQADGGTLFIDEVGELSAANQAKLLRAIETREVQPIGADKTRKVDIHLIAATNKNLRRAMEDGEFRDDLFYRLRGFTIQLSPLRERPEDIELLTDHFLNEARQEHGVEIEGFAPAVRVFFESYPWPGNVRELRHVVATAAVLAGGPLIDMADLPPDLMPPEVQATASPDPKPAREAPEVLLPLDEVTRRHLARVLSATGGNKSRTARVLGISRHALYRLLNKFGL